MSNEAVVNVGEPVPATAGLSQIERVVDTFVAPTKTFKDILRSASWWLPFVLILVTSIGFVVSVDRQVGFDRVYDNILRDSPKAQDQLNQLTPEARAQRVAIAVKFTKGISYASPVVILIVIGIYSLILWPGSDNELPAGICGCDVRGAAGNAAGNPDHPDGLVWQQRRCIQYQ
jgi:hypothetical protein